MLTSYTSSEEDKIPYIRKFAQNIRINNEGPDSCLKILLTSMHVDCFAISPDSRLCRFFPSLPIPQTPALVPKSP